jgi:acetyltransferase-like isoleucine patch superfamily enzyme
MQAEQAFFIANAGMECYLELLKADSDWSTPPAVFTNQAFGAGTFTVTYSNQAADSIDVTSTGKVTGWDGNSAQRVIIQHITKAAGAGTTFADFALFYGGGDGTITTDIKKNETIAGDIFIKGNLDIGKNCTITGYVSATGAVDVGNGTNISEGADEYVTQTVTQPTITTTNYDNLIAIASDEPSGDRLFDAETISGITYVDGDVTINDYIDGSGTIIVTGAVDIKANTDIGANITIISGGALLMRKNGTVGKSVTFYSSSDIELKAGIVLGNGAGAGEGVILLSPGNIVLGNNTTIAGFVFGNDITLGTNLDLTGNLSGNRLISLSQGAVVTKDSTKVNYNSIQGFDAGQSINITTSSWQEAL